MTNASKLVAPLWGAERMIGTNPIAIAFPGLEEPPVVIDLATSAVSYGKVQLARQKQKAVPAGWIIDQNGHSTIDPGGSMLEVPCCRWGRRRPPAGTRAML